MAAEVLGSSLESIYFVFKFISLSLDSTKQQTVRVKLNRRVYTSKYSL